MRLLTRFNRINILTNIVNLIQSVKNLGKLTYLIRVKSRILKTVLST